MFVETYQFYITFVMLGTTDGSAENFGETFNSWLDWFKYQVKHPNRRKPYIKTLRRKKDTSGAALR